MFDMEAPYRPADGIARWQTGSPSVAGLVATHESAAMLLDAGVDRLRAKSVQLIEYLIERSDAWLSPLGFTLASTRASERRGGHVVFAHDDAERIGRAAVAAGVIGDVRPPNLLRLAPAPLSTSFADVWDGLSRLRDVVASEKHLANPN
jgi:kynureninase